MSVHELLAVRLRFEHDVVIARQRAREAARLLGLGAQDQTRLATAVSEVARATFHMGDGGEVRFEADPDERPPALRVCVRAGGDGDDDDRAALGRAVDGAGRLLTGVERKDERAVLLEQRLEDPLSPDHAVRVAEELRGESPNNPFEELQQQNEELVQAMATLRERESERERLLAAEREAREEAQQAVRSREEVLSVVSHDLRNPIGAIITGVTFLLEHPELLDGGDGPGRRQLQAIRRSAARANRLIRDLLDISSIDEGKLAVKLGEVAVPPLLEQLREEMDRSACDLGLDLDVSHEADLPPVVADRDRILQVLENLVGNALKFTDRGGRVEVSAASRGDWVRFAVEDNGPGIPEEQQVHLFDRFWQSPERAGGGAGLGLAIVKGIVESHDGRIEVESEVGEGTRFAFDLPAARTGTARGTPSGAPPTDP